jgi:serine/threonine-protein kinase HipA
VEAVLTQLGRNIHTARLTPVGEFVYGRRYLERSDAVELDPVELKLGQPSYETARMGGFFGAIRDAVPDFRGRRVIERNRGATNSSEFDYLLHGPDDRAGALGFGRTAVPPDPRRDFSSTLDLAQLQSLADVIINSDAGRTIDQTDAHQVQALASKPGLRLNAHPINFTGHTFTRYDLRHAWPNGATRQSSERDRSIFAQP